MSNWPAISVVKSETKSASPAKVATSGDATMGNTSSIVADTSPQKSGTKKERISASKRWCFTANNYTEEDEKMLATVATDLEFLIYGHEIAPTTGTPHLQGYLEFKSNNRPFSLKLDKKFSWRKAHGTREKNVGYCSKGENIIILPKPRELKVLPVEKLKDWQKEIIDIIEKEPDDRTINWYWEPNGGVGKSVFSKFLAIKYNAIILSGKATDMKYAIAQLIEKKKDPKLIVIDIPRQSMDYLSYAGIEEIKNGCFFSGKYESGQVLYDCPHVIIFANEEPQYGILSHDRWIVKRIN